MNALEKRMVETLTDLRENHHVYGVKAEFEAEGTRLEEALRLKEVITKAGLDLTIKIGGCEALKDMYDARAIGVSHLVSPMIESAYALKKYLASVKQAFPKDEMDEVEFLINIETIQGHNNLDEMLSIPEFNELDGVILGRVDMTGSLGMTREDVNSDRIYDIALDVAQKIKAKGKVFGIGGGVSKETVPFINKMPKGLVDKYETRKVIFKCPDALDGPYDKGILKAVGFELMWLKNKRSFYGQIFDEDMHRIEMLEKRYERLIKEAGGKVE